MNIDRDTVERAKATWAEICREVEADLDRRSGKVKRKPWRRPLSPLERFALLIVGGVVLFALVVVLCGHYPPR
jgi:hypothetical protein